MSQNSLKLEIEIAELPFQFYCKRKGDASFLKEKYSDFLLKEGVKKPVGKIFLTNRNFQKIRAEGNKFYLPQISIKNHFRQFNDLFRIVAGYVLNRNQGFVFHASSLVKNGYGYIFIGKENAGKSTVRKLFPELVCLGDDSAVIRKVNKHFFLFGSPFYQRTQKSYPNRKVPIKAVFSLNQTDYNLVKLLSFPESFTTLSANSFIADISEKSKERRLVFEKVMPFCQENKIFSLFFKKERSFLPLLDQAADKDFLNSDKDRILGLINPQVRKKLPREMIWTFALGSRDFLEKCLVIKETSWNFEFDGKRLVKEIAEIASSSSRSSPHIELINKIKTGMKERDLERWIILVEKRGFFTIIDGNHQAIATYLQRKKRHNFKFLIAKLTPKKSCPWV